MASLIQFGSPSPTSIPFPTQKNLLSFFPSPRFLAKIDGGKKIREKWDWAERYMFDLQGDLAVKVYWIFFLNLKQENRLCSCGKDEKKSP